MHDSSKLLKLNTTWHKEYLLSMFHLLPHSTSNLLPASCPSYISFLIQSSIRHWHHASKRQQDTEIVAFYLKIETRDFEPQPHLHVNIFNLIDLDWFLAFLKKIIIMFVRSILIWSLAQISLYTVLNFHFECHQSSIQIHEFHMQIGQQSGMLGLESLAQTLLSTVLNFHSNMPSKSSIGKQEIHIQIETSEQRQINHEL